MALVGERVVVHGAGRTDTGAHALAQTASFHVDTRLADERLLPALNAHLPEGVVVRVPRDLPGRLPRPEGRPREALSLCGVRHGLPSALRTSVRALGARSPRSPGDAPRRRAPPWPPRLHVLRQRGVASPDERTDARCSAPVRPAATSYGSSSRARGSSTTWSGRSRGRLSTWAREDRLRCDPRDPPGEEQEPRRSHGAGRRALSPAGPVRGALLPEPGSRGEGRGARKERGRSAPPPEGPASLPEASRRETRPGAPSTLDQSGDRGDSSSTPMGHPVRTSSLSDELRRAAVRGRFGSPPDLAGTNAEPPPSMPGPRESPPGRAPAAGVASHFARVQREGGLPANGGTR